MTIAKWSTWIISALLALFFLPSIFMSNSTNVSTDTFFDLNIWKIITVLYCGGLTIVFLYIKQNNSYEIGRIVNIFIVGYGCITVVWILWISAGWFLPPAIKGLSQFATEHIGSIILLLFIGSLFYKEK